MGLPAWESCPVGEYPVGGLLKPVCGIADPGDIDGGGGVRLWPGVAPPGPVGGGGITCCPIVDPGKPAEGGGVDLCNGLPPCPGWPGPVVIGIVGLFGLLEWRADNGWEPGWPMVVDKPDGKPWACPL